MAVPTVSVIVPVFNGEHFIAQTIATVLAQTYQDWELIIVDDGSADGTWPILTAAGKDPRVKIIQQVNQGPAVARNTGLAEALGNYLAFLDSDDLWDSFYLAKMVAALSKSPEAVLAFSGWQYIDDSGGLLSQSVIPFEGNIDSVRQDLFWRNAILPSGVIARAQAVRAVGGFDTHFQACEDWDLWLQLIQRGAFVAVPEVLMHYRTHSASATENVAKIEAEQLKVNQKHLGPFVEQPAQWSFQQRRAVGHTYFVSALGYFRNHDLINGVSKIRAAIEIWPEILVSDEFYYELGCVFQGRGLRGTSHALNLTESAKLIRSLLLPEHFNRNWAQAGLVLSQLAYTSGDRPHALSFAGQALQSGVWHQKRSALKAIVRALMPVGWWQSLRATFH